MSDNEDLGISFTDDFIKALKEKGHEAKGFVHEHTRQVSYRIDGDVYTSDDIDKSKFAGIRRRALMKKLNE